MKKGLLCAVLLSAITLAWCCCNENKQEVDQTSQNFISYDNETMNELQNKQEISELVTTFSIYADQMKLREQSELFTEDGVLIPYMWNEKSGEMHGREEIYQSCYNFMSLFDTAHHMNGQHLITLIDDTHATWTAYNTTTLIWTNEEWVRTATKNYIYYNDNYEKVDGKWLISSRESHFVYTETVPVQ